MANGSTFHPKTFYRKLDSLLTRIGRGAKTKEVVSLVLDELVGSFGADLGIRSGSLYRQHVGFFALLKGPVGKSNGDWPATIYTDSEAVALLAQHKNYIFADTVVPPWGNNSVAVLVGEDDDYLMVFRLGEGWVRETLEFSLNTIRSTVNYSRSTSRFRADLAEADEIQKSLLPKENPRFEGYEIAGRSIPAETVGGDLFDFQFQADKVLGIAIGDASGHGLPAALLARDVVTGLRMGIEHEMKISGVIHKLNRVINSSRLSTKFISLVYGELERNGTFVYVNAGHPPPLLVKEAGIERLDVGGTILGPIRETVFNRGFAFVDPGDLLIFFTDGIIERVNSDGIPFGEEGLLEYVGTRRGESAGSIIDRLFDHLARFGGGAKWRDDATVIIVKRID
jgi:hypothetical protein